MGNINMLEDLLIASRWKPYIVELNVEEELWINIRNLINLINVIHIHIKK
jgi:hypothetical protein